MYAKQPNTSQLVLTVIMLPYELKAVKDTDDNVCLSLGTKAKDHEDLVNRSRDE